MPNPIVFEGSIEGPTFSVGDIVRLKEGYVSAARRKVIWKVTGTPNPKASRKADRESYLLEPVSGGRGLYADAWMLEEASAADKARAAAAPEVETFLPGSVVTAARLKGANPDQRLVVLDARADGTYKVGFLGGSDRFWTKVPGTLLRRVAVEDI